MGAKGADLVVTGVGNAQHIAQLAIEQLIDARLRRGTKGARHHQPVFGQQTPSGGVAGEQLAIITQRQQIAAVDQDELAGAVETENRPLAVNAHEVGILDHPRVLLDQLQGKGLGILGRWRMQRGDIQHRQQLAVRVEHGHRGAGEVGMPDAEVIVLMTGERLLFLDAGADCAGAGVVLAPVRTEEQAGLAVRLFVCRVAEKLHGDAAVVGQQDHVTQLGDLPVQLLDPGAGDIDQLVGLILMLAQHLPRDETGFGRSRRVQAVVVHAAVPGARDDRITITGQVRRIGQR